MIWWTIQVSPLKYPMFSETDLWCSLLLCWAFRSPSRSVYNTLSPRMPVLRSFPLSCSRQLKLPNVEVKGQAKEKCQMNNHHGHFCYPHQCWWLFLYGTSPDFLSHNRVTIHHFWLILAQNDWGWVVGEDVNVNSSLKCFEIIMRKLSSTMASWLLGIASLAGEKEA